MNNFQRKGSVSNTHVGRDFEQLVQGLLKQQGLHLTPDHRVPCGLGNVRKDHAFDLGSDDPPVIVECKSHTWTSGGNIPSAKMKNWAEAMFYFHMAPPEYRKLFVATRSLRPGYGETLLEYFARTQAHMIPDDVEFWEVDEDTGTIRRVETEALSNSGETA